MEHTDKSLDDLLNEANTWSKRGENAKKAKFEPPRRKTPYPAKRPTEDDIDEDALPAAEPSADEDEDHEDYEDTDEALAVCMLRRLVCYSRCHPLHEISMLAAWCSG